ncbi:MAG: hypothetical protein R6U28_01020 [Cyclonatronaceae bacterium]
MAGREGEIISDQPVWAVVEVSWQGLQKKQKPGTAIDEQYRALGVWVVLASNQCPLLKAG